MRILLFCFIIFFSLAVSGQQSLDTTVRYIPTVHGKELVPFLDSLKATIFLDTLKYKKQDLVREKDEVYNQSYYSKLFIIQYSKNDSSLNWYSYKLDVIEPRKVIEFVHKCLDDKIIKMITVVNEVDTNFFPNVPGVLWIDLWDKVNFNPKVAGLVLNEKGNGSNFTNRAKVSRRKD